MRLDRYKIHTIDLVVDRLQVGEESRERLMTSLREALRCGRARARWPSVRLRQRTAALLFAPPDVPLDRRGVRGSGPAHLLVQLAERGLSPLQRTGRGGGVRPRQDRPRSRTLSLREGAVEPLGKYHNNMLFAILEMLGRRYDFTLDDPIRTLSESALNALLSTAMRSR